MSRKIIERLADAAMVAVRVAGDAWPRALVSATPIPEQWLGLLERSDGGRRLVPSGEDPRPQRSDRLLLVRRGPVCIKLKIVDLRSTDGHDVSGTCQLSLNWQARDDDLAALGRAILHDNELTLDGLGAALAAGGARAELEQFIHERTASVLVHDDLRAELLEYLRARMQRFLFSSGIELEGVVALELSSTSLAEQEATQRQAAAHVESIKARELVERATAQAASRRLEDMRGLLDKLKAATEDDSTCQWHELLPTLSPAERGRLLENLWRVTPDRQAAVAIVVVAGHECVWLDPAEPTRIIQRKALTGDLGGLRSVSCDPTGTRLLIGAARGVWLVDAKDGEVLGSYEVPGIEYPRTGFNACVLADQHLIATHSQLGAWRWRLDDPTQAEALLQPDGGIPSAIRAATVTVDGRVLFAADEVVHVISPDDQRSTLPPAPGKIRCLATEGGMVYVGTAEGCLAGCELDGTGQWRVLHQAPAAFESVYPRRWSDLLELVIPAGAAGVCGLYAQESVVASLMKTRVPVRRAWACDDLLVALTDHRDRLIVMKSDAARQEATEVKVRRLLGHSVQDACIVSELEVPEALDANLTEEEGEQTA
ncbi:MAG: hypothetical protein ABIG44_06875 [Planctomycetota bacterium]